MESLYQTAPEDGSPRRASPSAPGPDVLSRLDDGSGCASPERLVALWSDEGVRDAQDILQALDLPAEERVSLRELTMALDNELLAGGNGIHRAALISYKNEIQHLRARAEQARGERDKAKADLERAERRNLQLLREADERLAGAEALNRTRIRELERDFRERLAAQRGQAEQESEAATQQLEREGRRLRRQLSALGAREAELREELAAAAQEKSRLEEELAEVKRRLSRAEKDGQRLRRDLTQLLRHELDGALNPEDKLARLREDCERRCRELRDQNDELSSELELLRSHKKSRRESPCAAAAAAVPLSWSQTPPGSESDSDDGDMKRRSSSPRGAASGPDDSAAAVSIETEFALEKLKSKHQREIRQLNVQLETQVDYYERSLERMRHSMELERKDMAQAFKLEISEREEQKAEAERQARSLKEALDSLRHQLQRGDRSSEQERRTRRERADSEQNFAREIENLVQKLSAEKDQLEAELKLKMDQEVMTVRAHLEEAHADNAALRQRLCVLQQEVDELDGEVANKRRELEELERHRESSGQEADRLQQETAAYRQEAVSLSGRNAQLSAANAELSARRQGLQAQVRRLQEEAELERGRRLRLEEELGACMRELSEMEAELSTAVTERQKMEAELRREAALGEHKAQEAESDRGSLMTDSEETDLQNQVPEKVPLDGRAPGPNPREPVQADKLEPRVARTQAEGQAGRPSSTRPVSAQACATLDVARREGVELRERAAQLLARLREEQAQSRRLEEELRLRARQSAARMGLEEERHEKALAEARQRTQELEVKLKASRAVLRDKARQLQQQTAKNVKSSAMLKELYVENSQLLQALQQSERRHHHAHKDKKLLEDKVGALNRLLVDMVPAALLQA